MMFYNCHIFREIDEKRKSSESSFADINKEVTQEKFKSSCILYYYNYPNTVNTH